MSKRLRTYIIRSRFLVKDQGWKCEDVVLEDTTYEAAGREASRVARVLDGIYGDDHFWSVDCVNPKGGSYFQLFHGRLS